MKGKMMFNQESHHEHEHDTDKSILKKPVLKAKAMTEKTHKNNVKAHRKTITR